MAGFCLLIFRGIRGRTHKAENEVARMFSAMSVFPQSGPRVAITDDVLDLTVSSLGHGTSVHIYRDPPPPPEPSLYNPTTTSCSPDLQVKTGELSNLFT